MRNSTYRQPRISRDEAETLAIDVLGFLAADETRLAAFLRITGLSLADIRKEAASPEFLAGVFDFLLSDDSLLLVFAGHKNLDPNVIGAARRALMPNDTMENY
ncbi:MAG: DUF3572 family protein [Alphaproteobacteria bacterium]